MKLLPAVLLLVIVLVTGCAPEPHRTASVSPTVPAAEERLLPIEFDAATGRVTLIIPRLGEEMLYLNTLATGLGTMPPLLDRGQVGTSGVVRFERRGPQVLLVRSNTAHRAEGGGEALRRSVEESFPQTVLASFAIKSEEPGRLTVDATDFFLGDVFDVAGSLRRGGAGSVRVDRERSFIDGAGTGAFPINTEVRAVLSFVTDDPSPTLRRVAPDGRSVTLAQQHTFLQLPDDRMAPRAFDPRAGLFPGTYFDFAQGFDSDYRQRIIVRWRLEPADPAAYLRGELVEPVKPVIYYVDPAIPEPYRSAFIEGGLWWNDVLQAAGWRDAFRIEDLPAGADPLDARYPMIYWVHRQDRGPSVGPAFVDPVTGEIVGTVVRMDSYRSLVNHDIYMGLLSAAGPAGLQIDAQEFAMARRRQHMAHEIGHTLGLAHNFVAATQGRSSVMDYPFPLVELDDNGQLDISRAYRRSAGAHDTLAIRYAYTWFPDAASEAAGLRELVREAEASGLRFIADAYAPAHHPYPSVSQWVEGSDMLSALERTTAVRRLLIDRFDERAAQPGEPLAVLNRRFAHVYLHHRYALAGATKYVGGMEFGYALRGENTPITAVIPAADQRRALRAVLAALAPAELHIPTRVAALIPPVPFGYGDDLTLIGSPGGAAFDPIAAAHSLAQEIVDGLLHPQRVSRVVTFNAQDPANPSLDEVLTALVDATWRAVPATTAASPQEPALRRAAQRATLDAMLDLAGNRAATAEVRAVTELHLDRLRASLVQAQGGAAEDRAHRATALRDITRYFAGEDDPDRRPRPTSIPLPWP
jgi:hypothetical protein